MNALPEQRPASNSESRKKTLGVPAVQLPLEITAVCPRCEASLALRLKSFGADASPSRVTVTPEYYGPHRCADLVPQEPPC